MGFNYMHVFNPDNATQTIEILTRPRVTTTLSLAITDESSKETTTQTITGTETAAGYLSLTFPFSPRMGRNYYIEATISGQLVYRGKAFATNQAQADKFTLYPDYFEDAPSEALGFKFPN